MSTPFTPPLPGDPRASSQPQADPNPALTIDPTKGEAIVIEAPPPSLAPGTGVPARIPHLGRAASRGGLMLSRFGVGKTLILARFIPVVRSVINPLAGTVDVPVREFAIWQVTGAAIWTVTMTAVGYLAARLIPGVTRFVMPALAVVTAASVTLAIVQAVRARRAGRGRPDTIEVEELDEMPSPSLTSGSSGAPGDRKSTRLNSSHPSISRMPSSA